MVSLPKSKFSDFGQKLRRFDSHNSSLEGVIELNFVYFSLTPTIYCVRSMFTGQILPASEAVSIHRVA